MDNWDMQKIISTGGNFKWLVNVIDSSSSCIVIKLIVSCIDLFWIMYLTICAKIAVLVNIVVDMVT